MRVVDRLKVTLDPAASCALARHARRQKKPRATLARELIVEALQHRERLARQRRLARDYAAGCGDAEVLAEMEPPQLELLDDRRCAS